MNEMIRNSQTRSDELVPSRYALKIGDIDVLVISDGVLPLPTKMLGHNADVAARSNWFKEMFLPPDAFDWALNAVLVRSGERTILIDAGLGSDPDLHLPKAGQLIKRLGIRGYRPRFGHRRGACRLTCTWIAFGAESCSSTA